MLAGEDGNDTLRDLVGVGMLRGGTGDDIYVIDSTDLSSIVEQTGEGNDMGVASGKLVLPDQVENGRLVGSAAMLTSNARGNLLLGNDVASAAFTAAGQLRAVGDASRPGGGSLVPVDVDGDHVADLSFTVNAGPSPAAANFLL